MSEFFNADAKRCIACRACEVACEREHHGVSNVRVVVIEGMGSAPISCRHCGNSPCAAVCPHKALSSTPDGVVVLHRDRCTTCGLCIFACPFGAISLKDRTIAKCDLCAHRRALGAAPACISTCPTGAVTRGNCDAVSQEKRLRRAAAATGVPRTW